MAYGSLFSFSSLSAPPTPTGLGRRRRHISPGSPSSTSSHRSSMGSPAASLRKMSTLVGIAVATGALLLYAIGNISVSDTNRINPPQMMTAKSERVDNEKQAGLRFDPDSLKNIRFRTMNYDVGSGAEKTISISPDNKVAQSQKDLPEQLLLDQGSTTDSYHGFFKRDETVPFPIESHNMQPSDTWGDLFQAPLPTGAWWLNLVLDPVRAVAPQPYSVVPSDKGLQTCYPNKKGLMNVTTKMILQDFSAQLVVGTDAGEYQGFKIHRHDALSVTIKSSTTMGAYTSYLVRGSPYITVEFEGNETPKLWTYDRITLLDQTDTYTKLTYNTGEVWAVWSFPRINWSLESPGAKGKIATVLGRKGYKGFIRIAYIPKDSLLPILDAHARHIPLSGDLSYTPSSDAKFNDNGSPDKLDVKYRFHTKILPSNNAKGKFFFSDLSHLPPKKSIAREAMMLDVEQGRNTGTEGKEKHGKSASPVVAQKVVGYTAKSGFKTRQQSNAPPSSLSSATQGKGDADNGGPIPMKRGVTPNIHPPHPHVVKSPYPIQHNSLLAVEEKDGGLLMLAVHHHYSKMPKTDIEVEAGVHGLFGCMKGEMFGIVGDTWTMQIPLLQTGWYAEKEVPDQLKDTVRQALFRDVHALTDSWDVYNMTKQAARMARLVLIAEEIDQPDLRDIALENLYESVTPWLNGTKVDNSLVYDKTWGGIVTKAGLGDPSSDFGNGWYNDHHFQYGYMVYAFAVLLKHNYKDIGTTYGDHVRSIACDYANPPNVLVASKSGIADGFTLTANGRKADPDSSTSLGYDKNFPVARHKDFWDFHSWASGLFVMDDSKSQESSSEAVNSYYAIALLGSATKDANVETWGRLLLTMEVDATHRYWHMPSWNTLYPERFREHRMAGMISATRAAYFTWFGDLPEYIHCVNTMPYTPVTAQLLPEEYVKQQYPVLAASLSRQDPPIKPAWKSLVYTHLGILDPPSAWEKIQTVDQLDNGLSLTNALWWIATRPGGENIQEPKKKINPASWQCQGAPLCAIDFQGTAWSCCSIPGGCCSVNPIPCCHGIASPTNLFTPKPTKQPTVPVTPPPSIASGTPGTPAALPAPGAALPPQGVDPSAPAAPTDPAVSSAPVVPSAPAIEP